jgi:3-hydroxyacyl-CoA dehydrogenase/enoyl-CoA hydratase/3-hydroxybutyryl-CoA epimerase
LGAALVDHLGGGGGGRALQEGGAALRWRALCEALAHKHGPRFAPNAMLRSMAAEGQRFYP